MNRMQFWSDFPEIARLRACSALLTVLLLCCVNKISRSRWFYVCRKTFGRDARLVRAIFRMLSFTLGRVLIGQTVVDVFRSLVKRQPDKAMTIFVDEEGRFEVLTYQQAEHYSNQVSHFFRKRGFAQGQTVSIFLENRLDYNCTWLGLAKIGAISALINTNVRGESLTRLLELVSSQAVICSNETMEALLEVAPDLDPSVQLFNIDQEEMTSSSLQTAPVEYVAKEVREEPSDPLEGIQLSLSDPLLYVFTSGTTGLPKAAKVNHKKYLIWGTPLQSFVLHHSKNDILYTALPMYHTSALGFFGAASMLTGLTMVCRKRFSASNFWKDCVDHNVTAAQYIGEVARYLCNSPVTQYESEHQVRWFLGNGLQKDLFRTVQERFRVKIAEIYASTEGNCGSMNYVQQPGAIGFISQLLPFLTPQRLVRVDTETNQVVRQDSLCVPCKPGETGELVSPITRISRFDGYLDRAASEAKVLRNVFRKGDACFRTGDLMTMDELGFLYFVDRCGDTFRWKGENVSTLEVEDILRSILGEDRELAVYGVKVPGNEGRACMLALRQEQLIQHYPAFLDQVKNKLPFYAIPMFIRYVRQFETTGTYKLKKQGLKREGFFPKNEDSIFVLSKAQGTYLPLSEEHKLQIECHQYSF